MISVIILTYNRKSELLKCLERLARQTYRRAAKDADFEVIVIDNGSTDGTPDAIREFPSVNVRCVENRETLSFASARNLGIKLANGDIVAFLDDDCEPDDDWLERIAENLSRLDAVGGIVLPPVNLRYPYWWHPELNWLVGLSPPGLLGHEAAGTHYPQTANMAIRRSVLLNEPFQEIGIEFSSGKNVYRAGREDAELWRRLRLNGYRTLFDPNLRVRHNIPQNRLRLGYIARRAFTDGVTYYSREEKDGYVGSAAMDVALAPFRALRDTVQCAYAGAPRIPEGWQESFGKLPRSPASILVRHFVWTVRQMGFMRAYLRGDGKPHRLLTTVASFAGAYFSATAAALKKATRKIAVTGYRQLRLGRKMPPHQAPSRTKPESILVVGCGFLGDMVIMLPSMQLLRQRFPSSRLTLLTHPLGERFYKQLKIFDEIITCPDENRTQTRREPGALSNALSGKHFDVSLIEYFHNAPAAALFKRATGLRISYDRDVGFRRQIWYDLADLLVEKDLKKNEIENSRAILEPLGISDELKPYKLDVPQEAVANIEKLINNLGISQSRLAVLNPESAIPYKLWSNQRWMELAKRIEGLGNFQIIITCYSTPPNTFEHLARKHGIRARCLRLQGVWELAALIKRAEMLITLDSGPKHLAFALGTPTITLYGNSDERRWGAYWETEKHFAIRACPFDLSYEELLNLPQNHQMLCITPDLVCDAFSRVVQNNA